MIFVINPRLTGEQCSLWELNGKIQCPHLISPIIACSQITTVNNDSISITRHIYQEQQLEMISMISGLSFKLVYCTHNTPEKMCIYVKEDKEQVKYGFDSFCSVIPW
jgi:hypothetical protein